MFFEEIPGIGFALDEESVTDRSATSIYLTSPDVPPFPCISMIKPAEIPPPPLLCSSDSSLKNAKELGRIYREAIRRLFDVESTIFLGSVITKNHHYETVRGAAEALIKMEIPPIIWADWRCKYWRDSGMGKRLNTGFRQHPPIDWVFSARYAHDHADWFWEGYDSRLQSCRVIMGKNYVDLLRRYSLMMFDLRQLRGSSAKAIVDKHFPPEATYYELVKLAQVEAAQQQADIDNRLSAGEFLWG